MTLPRPLCPHDQPCGRPECLFTCLQAYMPRVLRRLRRRFPPNIADEAADDAEVIAIKAIRERVASGMTSQHRKNWLHFIARNRAATLMRHRLVILPDLPPTFARTENNLLDRQQAVRDALRTLPARQQVLLERHYFDGQKLAEVADEFGISRPALSRAHQKALDALRAELIKKGYLTGAR